MENNKNELLMGGVVFGIVLTISVIVVFRLGSQIVVGGKSPFSQFVLSWLLDWILIIGTIVILRLIWKKMIEPYK